MPHKLIKCKDCAFWLQIEANPKWGECRKALPKGEKKAAQFIGIWPETIGEKPGCGEGEKA